MKKLLLMIPFLSACVNAPISQTPPVIEEITRTQPPKRGIKPIIVLNHNRQPLLSYNNSYALIIGQSKYSNGWSSLATVPSEVTEVETVLQEQGFVVEKHLNLNAVDLKASYTNFIKNYGYERENRLLFFFSGHGYSRKNGKKGYIVPTDAPNPKIKGKETAFLQNAISMTQINAWAKEIEALHTLFLFDSCFSGTVFQNKAISDAPPYITEAIKNPARQFITAGSADEMVPANSVFTPAFVNALRYKKGDLNGDGYVTGVELGFYLANEVPKHEPDQHPQHGKIKGYEYSLGDFVFVLDNEKPTALPPPPMISTKSPVLLPQFRQDAPEIMRLKREIALAKQETADLRHEKEQTDLAKIALKNEQKEILKLKKAKAVADKKKAEMRKKLEAAKKPPLTGMRYTDNDNGTVTDNKSGLIWMKNADCFRRVNWKKGMELVANLSSESSKHCELHDDSQKGDWRLPTKNEWEAMINATYSFPILSNAAGTEQWTEGDAFTRVTPSWYWSSTMDKNSAWSMFLGDGVIYLDTKLNAHYIWPVKEIK